MFKRGIENALERMLGSTPDTGKNKVPSEQQYSDILEVTRALLKPLGFAKQGDKFRKFYGSNVALIQFQRSQWNDATELRFTINISIISAAISAALGDLHDLKKASEMHGHVRQRIGFFDEPQFDRWWSITAETNPKSISAEIIAALTGKVLPFIDAHATDAGLAILWESGKAPGITEGQQKRFLAALKAQNYA